MKFPHRSQLINIKCCVVYTNDSFFFVGFFVSQVSGIWNCGEGKKERKKNEMKRNETIISCYARDFFVFFLGSGKLGMGM